jgi:hypothetical protein
MTKTIYAMLLALAFASPAVAGEWKAVNSVYGKNMEHSSTTIVRRGADNALSKRLGMGSEMYYEYHPSAWEKMTGSYKAMLPPGGR